MKSFVVPDNEIERLAALRRYELLDTPIDSAFDRITGLAARLLRVPIAIMSLVDADRIWLKSHHGMEISELSRDQGLCAQSILSNQPWFVTDARNDGRTAGNPLVTGGFGLRFYAAAPLTTNDGYNIGALCVIDKKPRDISSVEIAILQDLAAIVMDKMELRRASRQIAELEATLRQRAVEEQARLQQQAQERTVTEQALRDSEERYHSLAELSADWYWEQDEQHSLVAVATDNGMAPPECITTGKPLGDMRGFWMSQKEWLAYDAALAAQQPFYDLTCRYDGPDGKMRYGELSGRPVLNSRHDKLTGYRGICKDITERMRRDEDLRRFRTAMDATADAIFLVDRASMRFIDFNDTFCHMLGYNRSELLELGPADIEVGLRDQLERLYDNLIAGRRCRDLTEVELRRKNGSLWPAEIHRRILRSGDRWVMVIVARDISERRQAQGALAQSHAVLRQLLMALQTIREEERKRVARELHDDLGQLLAALRMDLSLLLQHPMGDVISRQLTAHMDQLIAASVNSVRRIAKDLRPKALDEGGLYYALQLLLKEYMAHQHIACELCARESELALDDTRSTAIFRIIQESLTNISRHAKARNVLVELSRTQDSFSIRIKDDGCGITDADMKKTHSFGLVGMRERVHELCGTIDISGAEGQGTSINILLPLPE